MFLNLIAQILVQSVSSIATRAVEQAHFTPQGQPLPPVAAQVQQGAVVDVAMSQIQQDPALQPKEWYRSRTLWGAVVAIVAPLIQLASGYAIDDGQQQMVVDVIMAVAAAVGGVLAFYGRVKATRSIAIGRGT